MRRVVGLATPKKSWRDRSTHRTFFDGLAESLGIHTWKDMCGITTKMIKEKGGSGVMYYYNENVHVAFENIYPEFKWYPWMFQTTSHLFWKDSKNQLSYMKWLQEELQIEKEEDWYDITSDDVKSLGGSGLLNEYGGSLELALNSIFKHHVWHTWLFRNHSVWGFWTQTSNQKKYLDWLAEKLNIETQEDWYNIKRDDFERNRGEHLIRMFGGSVIGLLESIFPMYEWNRNFSGSYNFWQQRRNQRNYFDTLARSLNLQTQEEWYRVKQEDILKKGGKTVLQYHDNSLIKALEVVYPEFAWYPWKFEVCPRGYWSDLKNQRKFMDWVEEELGIEDKDDWYKIKYSEVADRGGYGLLNYYDGYSLKDALQTIYPEHRWHPWLFHQVPRGYWNKWKNVCEYIQWFAQKLNLKSREDWRKIPMTVVIQQKGFCVMKRGLNEILDRYYETETREGSVSDLECLNSECDPTKSQQRLAEVVALLCNELKPKNATTDVARQQLIH